jgi:4-amino-4-deoxychorismate lyase
MSLLTESIRVYNGRVYNIKLHNQRCNQARSALFGSLIPLDLRSYIQVPDAYSEGLVKCRILYNQSVQDISFEAYSIRMINKLCIIENNTIQYPYKFTERPELDQLYHRRKEADEIIIVKNGLITDAYYYNIVLSRDGDLFTPASPLLEGTRRAALLKHGKLKKANIHITELYSYNTIYLVNALSPLGSIKIRVKPENILQE